MTILGDSENRPCKFFYLIHSQFKPKSYSMLSVARLPTLVAILDEASDIAYEYHRSIGSHIDAGMAP